MASDKSRAGGRGTAERVIADSNTGRTTNPGLEITGAQHFFSDQIIASLHSDVKPLVLSSTPPWVPEVILARAIEFPIFLLSAGLRPAKSDREKKPLVPRVPLRLVTLKKK